MATYTSNYGWTKPSGSDNVDISVLNNNLDDQDSTIHDAFLNMAPPFSESSTYAVDDIVLYGTGLYKCHTAVVTPGSWTGSTNWQVYKLSEGGSGGGGTSNYNQLSNKPQINSVELSGNKTASQLGLMASDGVVANPTGQTTGTLTALEVGGTKYAVPSGGGGTSDYTDLTNKPSINGVTLSGNKTTSDLGINADNVMMSDGVTSVEDALAAVYDIVGRTYKGVDLTVNFADEIANYTDAWAWFQARLDADNLEGIHVKDYIPFSVSGENHKARIAGIDTFHKTGSTEVVGHHVDFISEDCYGTTHRYNATNTNQGNATTGSSFKASELYSWLNSTVYNALPAELKAVIKEKYLYYPLRYTSGSNLTDDNNWEFGSFGKLWLPLEGEIFDTPQWSTKGYGNPCATQYPIFANDASARIKGAGPGGNRANWWTASAYSGSATYFVYVAGTGYDGYDGASDALSVPICFRLIKAA